MIVIINNLNKFNKIFIPIEIITLSDIIINSKHNKQEEKFMAKKCNVNKDLCIGCGLCTSVCPDVLVMGDDGLAECTVAEVAEDLEASLEEAAASCPVQAIEVE